MNRPVLAALGALALSGCINVGPDYVRPESTLPEKWGTPAPLAAVDPAWWKLFNDAELNKLVDEALANNRDIAIAAARVEQARGQLAVVRSDQSPDVGIRGSHGRERQSQSGSFPVEPQYVVANSNRWGLAASWELDFWGKYRRATEAARADLLATEAGRDAVRATLVSDVVRGYLSIGALDRAREIALRTLEGRRIAMDLQQQRLAAGVISELELRQLEASVAAAEALVPALEQDRLRQETALAVLLGRSPREVYDVKIARGTLATPMPQVPPGLPSEILLRRPDLRESEARLVAANARIGVARAAYFPSIGLTGFYGSESVQLSNLFTGPASAWNLVGGLTQPLWAGGQIRGGVEIAEARQQEAALQYQQAIANAFREVRNALSAQSNASEAVAAELKREKALAAALELQVLRYKGGLTNLFELLQTESDLLQARLLLIDAERLQRAAIVDLYTALGI
jgi:multidrug efflux system outer membrane protein